MNIVNEWQITDSWRNTQSSPPLEGRSPALRTELSENYYWPFLPEDLLNEGESIVPSMTEAVLRTTFGTDNDVKIRIEDDGVYARELQQGDFLFGEEQPLNREVSFLEPPIDYMSITTWSEFFREIFFRKKIN